MASIKWYEYLVISSNSARVWSTSFHIGLHAHCASTRTNFLVIFLSSRTRERLVNTSYQVTGYREQDNHTKARYCTASIMLVSLYGLLIRNNMCIAYETLQTLSDALLWNVYIVMIMHSNYLLDYNYSTPSIFGGDRSVNIQTHRFWSFETHQTFGSKKVRNSISK